MDRFTLCLEKGLLAKLDEITAERGYPSRSQAMADFIRRAMVKKSWKAGRECAGTISVHYKAGAHSPAAAVEALLAKYAANIAAVQSIMLKHGGIMLTASVTGEPAELEKLADALRALKGVTHGAFSIVTQL